MFLASNQAKNITGSDFLCDGGVTRCLYDWLIGGIGVMAMGGWDKRIGYPTYTD